MKTRAKTRIVSVEAFHLASPLAEPLGGSARRGPLTARETVIVRVTSNNGLVGYGESSGPASVLAAAVRHLAPVVVGADPYDRNALATALLAQARAEGLAGILVAAASGIDLAVWDLTAKTLGIPLVTLLGGAVRSVVPVYAASIYFSPLEHALEVARQFVARGFGAIKIKVGTGLEEDVGRVAAIREAVGGKVRLLLDANGAYDAKTAIVLARRCVEYGISWFEEPVPAHNLEGCRAVQRAVQIPVAAGENLHTRYGFEPWMAARAFDVAMPDLGRCGGLTEAAAIAAMAAACGITVSPHCWGHSVALAAAVHLAAALPHCTMLEFDACPDPLRDELIGEGLAPRDGTLAVSERPGIGIEVREAALHDLAVAREPGG